MKTLYFTATGNSLSIAKSFGGEHYSIPQMIKEGTYDFTDMKIGIVFPIYGLSVPPYVIEFLTKATFNCDYLFAIMTYGMYDGASTNHLLTIARQTGKNFNYINTIKMVDTWLPRFEMKKQIDTAPKKQIEKHLASIVSDINDSKKWIQKDTMVDKLITNKFLKAAKQASYKEVLGSYIIGQGIETFFTVEDSCNQCGTCSKVCPVNNVRLDHGKVQYGDQCIGCLACTQNCPQNAIRLNGEKSKIRFRNPNIALKEIIEANN